MPASGQYQGIDSADGTGFVTPSGVTSGFSGAPVVNAAGQLVGVVVQLDDGSTTKIIPIHSIVDAIKRATRSQNTRENSIATRVAKNFETTIPTCYPEKRVSDFVQGCQDNPPSEDGTCETCVYTRQQEELRNRQLCQQAQLFL